MASDEAAPFDESALLADARRRTGLEDFGDEGFREPLRVLLASLADAPLNAVGSMVLRMSIRRSLKQRLLARQLLARHPEIADERIEAPLVVVGMMRSGTTLLQRLLARDPRCYSALGWEIAEPVPRPGHEEDDPDPRIAAGKEQTRQMRAFAPELYAIHPTDAMEPDEEIVFLADAFLSHVPEASCHVPVYRAWLDQQDFTPAYEYLRTMLQLLQWQKRQRGDERQRWVLKTPAHLGYLDTVFSVFPDAHVVHMHRSPLETIPSGASLNLTLWRMYADEVDPHEIGRQWVERMAWATRRALAARAGRADEAQRFTDIGFRDAVTDPIGQVRRIHESVGLELPDGAQSAMERWLDADRGEKRPAHRYTAEAFGLSPEAISAAFAEYEARFAPFLVGGNARA